MQVCDVWWKTVPEGGARNRKTPFADGGKVERRYCKLEVDRSLCRDGTSVTRVKYDDRYADALPNKARNIITAILNRMRSQTRSQWLLAELT